MQGLIRQRRWKQPRLVRGNNHPTPQDEASCFVTLLVTSNPPMPGRFLAQRVRSLHQAWFDVRKLLHGNCDHGISTRGRSGPSGEGG